MIYRGGRVIAFSLESRDAMTRSRHVNNSALYHVKRNMIKYLTHYEINLQEIF